MDRPEGFLRHDLIPWFADIIRSCMTIDHCNSTAVWIIDLKERNILSEQEEEFWLNKIGQKTQSLSKQIYEKIEKRAQESAPSNNQ